MSAHTEVYPQRSVLIAVAVVLGVLAVCIEWNQLTGPRVLGLLVVFGLGGGISVASAFYSSKTRRTRFGAREDLGTDGVYRQYYAESGVDKRIFIRVWNECAQTLGVAPGKLRPSDSFEREFQGLDKWKVTGDAVGYLIEDAAMAARRVSVPFDATAIVTLDDLVRRLVTIESTER